MERAPSHGKEGQPGLGPSVRGMFSDLKRTMERVGELYVHNILHNYCLAADHASCHDSQIVCMIVLDMSEAKQATQDCPCLIKIYQSEVLAGRPLLS